MHAVVLAAVLLCPRFLSIQPTCFTKRMAVSAKRKIQLRVANCDWTNFRVLWCKDSGLLNVGGLAAKIIAWMYAPDELIQFHPR
jgi:hypothetical protein